MEPVTHILTGACLSRAGLNRRAAYTTLTMALAAEFPDIDTLWSLRGPVASFQHHRGITHTFAALPVEAGLIVAAVYVLHKVRVAKAARADAPETKQPLTHAPLRWGLLYGFALLALFSHLLLDYSNNYGLRPFFPFNPHWYAGSFVFIFDPLTFLLLALAFIMPPLFALVNSEVGARQQPFRGRGWAIASLLCIGFSWSLRAVEHSRAEQLAAGQSMAVFLPGAPDTPQFTQPLRVFASPDPFSPFRWHIVSDFGGFYQLAEVNLLNGSLTPAQDIHPKPESTLALQAAQASALGRVYMDWSPMPFLSESQPGDPTRAASNDDPSAATSTVVTFRDPRFIVDLPLLRSRPNPPLTGTVELDPQNRVVRQTMDGTIQR
jgi:inner membrane protein